MATSLPLTPKPDRGVEQGVMDIKVGSLSLCPLRNYPKLVLKLSNNYSRNKNLVSPAMTVEQCVLPAQVLSLYSGRGERVWPLVPKNKILASFFLAILTQQRIGWAVAGDAGRARCCRERTEEET